MDHPNRKIIRLPHERYANPQAIVSVTITVQDRRPIFLRSGGDGTPPLRTLFGDACHAAIAEHATLHHIPIYAWTIMPDHLHVCCSPTPDRDLLAVVAGIKQRLTRIAWSHGIRGTIWQRSFFDHFLRADEDIAVTCRYIWNNAVRAGIVEQWNDYPYNGSTMYNLAQMA